VVAPLDIASSGDGASRQPRNHGTREIREQLILDVAGRVFAAAIPGAAGLIPR
jgi:hypothetical protein